MPPNDVATPAFGERARSEVADQRAAPARRDESAGGRRTCAATAGPTAGRCRAHSARPRPRTCWSRTALAVRAEPVVDAALRHARAGVRRGVVRPHDHEAGGDRRGDGPAAPAVPPAVHKYRAAQGSSRFKVQGMLTRQSIAATALVLALLPAAAASAQSPTGLAEPGDPTSARPGILEQDRDRPEDRPAAAARPAVRGRQRPPGQARRLLRRGGQAAGGPGARVLRVPDAVHAGAQRPGVVDQRDEPQRRQASSTSSPSASTRRKGPGWRRRRKRTTSSATDGRRRPDGWHFLTGTQESIARLTDAVGFRYELDKDDRPVRARRRHRGDHAEGHDREVLLRHRVLAARSAARPGRGLRGAHRLADR